LEDSRTLRRILLILVVPSSETEFYRSSPKVYRCCSLFEDSHDALSMFANSTGDLVARYVKEAVEGNQSLQIVY
jgi:hypothetical protein